MAWELRIEARHNGGSGAIYHFRTKPSKKHCQQRYYATAGGYVGPETDPEGVETYSLKWVKDEGIACFNDPHAFGRQ